MKIVHDLNNVLCSMMLNLDFLFQMILDGESDSKQREPMIKQLLLLQDDLKRIQDIIDTRIQEILDKRMQKIINASSGRRLTD